MSRSKQYNKWEGSNKNGNKQTVSDKAERGNNKAKIKVKKVRKNGVEILREGTKR
jgi:hypothetical protein